MIICANIEFGVDNIILWHKALPVYIEGGAVCIEFKTGTPGIVYKGEGGDIRVNGCVTNGVDNLL